MKLMELVQGTPEWLEWRKSGVGASEVAAILGIDPYGNTPYSTWLVKTGRAKGFEGNSATKHGQELEAKARARYEFKKMIDMTPACGAHPAYEFLLASFDGINLDESLILELKCPKGSETLEAAKQGRIVDHYVPQTQAQLLVSGLNTLHFFVYHDQSGQDELVIVKPDLKLQGEIVVKVEHFWKTYVLTDTPPPLMAQDAKQVEDDEIKQACSSLISLKEKKDKSSKAESDRLKAFVIERGGHSRIRCGNVLVSKSTLDSGKISYRMTVSGETKVG